MYRATKMQVTNLPEATSRKQLKRGESPRILAQTRHLVKSNGSILGSEVAQTIEPLYPTFFSAVEQTPNTAIASVDGRSSISHERVRDFCEVYFGPKLHELGFGRGHRIAVVLPNGPELALCIVATASWASCVPLSATGAAAELEEDLKRCGADLVIGPYVGSDILDEQPSSFDNSINTSVLQGYEGLGSIQQSADKLGIPFVGLIPSPTEAGIFRLVMDPSSLSRHQVTATRHSALDTRPNTARDEALVLFTSGTTGNKKLVPHLMGDMLTAATTVALSWDLTPSDVNCNLMPLFHVGGIVRQVFAPLVSGGAVICCPSFDTTLFWTLLSQQAFTWYYAAPTMHQMILQTHDPEECPNPRLRMIANAAGGLLPSLAVQMRQRFQQATVLPSYGMTECMPISSPPATYDLSKPGTSGVPVGPEVGILNISSCSSSSSNNNNMKMLPPGVEGAVCVRGQPCFRGYGALANAPHDAHDSSSPELSTFLPGGWFNTGDNGYLDEDGYLYITGRSKEVINRGGEIISPMEVEEAVFGHPQVEACAAFSAKHDVLQEVVGIVLVMSPGAPRLDLRGLHMFLATRLTQPKWPQCLVYLDALPKSGTNKLLRVKLGERFGLPLLSDALTAIQRTFEGTCPPPGTALDVSIPARPVQWIAQDVEEKLQQALRHHDNGGRGPSNHNGAEAGIRVVENPRKHGSLICYLYGIQPVVAAKLAPTVLDGYAIPAYFVQIASKTKFSTLVTTTAPSSSSLPEPQSKDATENILLSSGTESTTKQDSSDALTTQVQQLLVLLLGLDFCPAPTANFFQLGGSSMLASQLASKIRKEFGISCSGAEIFHHPSSADLADMIRQRRAPFDDSMRTATDVTLSERDDSLKDSKRSYDDRGASFESKRLPPVQTWWSNLFQLVPMFVVFPIWQVSRYMLFFAVLLQTLDTVPSSSNVGTFLLAYITFHFVWITITPLIFVLLKWLIIGRYRPGRYPIWSSYYLRWWFLDICRQLFLRGIWGSNPVLLNVYYRLLGAKIGKGARISLEAEVAEFDLVSIGENAAVEMCTLRGFGVDNGAMILGTVQVGNHSSVGVRSVVAPNTSIPDDSHLGPATSSYDAGGMDPKFARINRQLFPKPNLFLQTLVVGTISFLVNCWSQLPPFLIMLWMVSFKSEDVTFDTPNDLLEWLCDPRRIPFYVGIRIARAVISPFFYMTGALCVKYMVIGTFHAGPRDALSQWQLVRHELSATLFARSKIQAVVDVIGRHYELVSCLYRLLGAKVGKRVFWPGYQPVLTGEFDLLEIGDDVVFGSRSFLFCATSSTLEKVILCAGSNVSDNCVVLPGSTLMKGATLGSNSVCPQGWTLPERSVWFGSNNGKPICLEQGEVMKDVEENSMGTIPACMVGDETTLRPFGKALYKREARYFAWPVAMMATFSMCMKICCATFHSMPLLFSLHAAAAVLFGEVYGRDYQKVHYDFPMIYTAVLASYFVVNILRVIAWLLIELTAKWVLIGRREPGTYNYDTSSYAQRWELYQQICKIRKFSRFNFLQFFVGTPFLNHYFRWNGGKIGCDVCLYPTGADPFMPEPDLVSIGDRCVVDCASIVCHLNTRGNFALTGITIESDCTLRCRSRVQQGVHMEAGSQLLEKSVAMTGEALEENSVWAGCPANPWFQL